MAKDAIQKTMGDTIFKVWWWSLVVYIVSLIVIIIGVIAAGLSLTLYTNPLKMFTLLTADHIIISIAMFVRAIANIVLVITTLVIVYRAFKLTKYYRNKKANGSQKKISSSRKN